MLLFPRRNPTPTVTSNEEVFFQFKIVNSNLVNFTIDPLSLTVSIAGLLGLALQLKDILMVLVTDVKDAPKAISDLSSQVLALQGVSAQFQPVIKKDETQIDPSSVLFAVTSNCQAEIKALLALLPNMSTLGSWEKTWTRLKWPFQKKELEEIMIKFVLLIKTSQEVSEVLKQDLDALKQISVLSSRFNTFSSIVDEKAGAAKRQRLKVLDLIRGLPNIVDNISDVKESAASSLEIEYISHPLYIAKAVLKQHLESFRGNEDHIASIISNLKTSSANTELTGFEGELISLTRKSLSPRYIIIDALDELKDDGRKNILLPILQRLANNGLKILITSRSHTPDIRQCLVEVPEVVIKARNSDIIVILEQRFLVGDFAEMLTPDLEKMIREKIVKSAQGMFLLAEHHISSIQDQPTVWDMQRALEDIPEGLEETFNAMFQRIKDLGQNGHLHLYAARFWPEHAKKSSFSPEVVRIVVDWMLGPSFQAGLILTENFGRIRNGSYADRTPLNIAAAFELIPVLEKLIARRQKNNNLFNAEELRDIRDLASLRRNHEITKIMGRAEEAERSIFLTTIKTSVSEQPLHAYGISRHRLDLVEILIKAKMDPNNADECGKTPLHKVAALAAPFGDDWDDTFASQRRK
ncbi:hypothetical protein G7Y89_g14953 [Cudoniella acicularis]|uniref:Nephrocystin 3-like N-terminal domain-containing protein n=1 Tax=Cudoniella acicularis TaxID=354080 RepID=A0A8H4QX35_9HELO|nr:hypothetical protein G7Y89_g14953 [Cudoniella acicularis]